MTNTAEENKKRDVSPALKKLLAFDAHVTDRFVKEFERLLTFRTLAHHYRALEISCHGILWIVMSMACIWIFSSRKLYQMQVNLLIGLFLDIVIIAVLKSITRRRRPTVNDDPFGIGPDKYSFPSGHASRSSFLAYFFIRLWPVHFMFVPSILAWTISVCVSRVLIRKHYLLDMIAGMILGLLLGMFLGVICMSEETATDLVSWLTDEKFDGGEFHV